MNEVTETSALSGTVVDMAELFRRDPLKYSQQDLQVIVARFREARKQFDLGNKKAGLTKLSPNQKKAEELGGKLSLDLDL